MSAQSKFPLEYKGFPICRKGNTIYYGNPSDRYMIQLQVLSSAPLDDMTLATKVSIQLQNTDPNLKNRDRVVRSSEKNSLYAAMDLANVWLTRALATR